MCHLVFLQLMYVLVCKSYHIGQTLSNTLRLLASVRHYVNLQCHRESGSVRTPQVPSKYLRKYVIKKPNQMAVYVDLLA